jgi:hypothetical protein
MRKIFLPVILSAVFTSSVTANYIDGNLLKSMSVAPVTQNSHLQFVGYVIGVIDSNDQNILCVNALPNGLTPVLDEVINYLADNPKKLNAPGNQLVVEALLPKYSCASKAKS